jgi:hypothetical protein
MSQKYYEYDESTGVITPDTSLIRDTVAGWFKEQYGMDLVVTSDTPQGKMIDSITRGSDGGINNDANSANQINPIIAGGVFLDAIMSLTGSKRISETFGTAVLSLSGLPGTIIPSGSRVSNTLDGSTFTLTSNVTLDLSGQGASECQAVSSGGNAILSGTITQIIDAVPGWDTVTNPSAGIQGMDTQSDSTARKLRRATLGAIGTNSHVATLATLRAIPSIRSATGLINDTSVSVIKETIPMLPYSCWYCVVGNPPTDLEVAEILWYNKGNGAQFNGSIVVPVTDAQTGVLYDVKFDRGSDVLIEIQITITSGVSAPTESEVTDAVLNYTKGEVDGFEGWELGTDVSSFEIAAAVRDQIPNFFIDLVEVGYQGGSVSPLTLNININEIALTAAYLISVIYQ